MALQVWLPLNGTLENKGLYNITVTNNGATVDNNGKIGKCYSFGDGNTSSKGIYFNTNLSSELGNSRSICAWVYPKGNHLHYSGAIASSGNWNKTTRWAFCLKKDNTGFTGFDTGFNSYYSTTIPINTWTHLCVTVENGVTKFYKNGEYLGQQSRGSGNVTSDVNITYIGRESYADGYFTFNGNINDVRIYDHCLSDKEVKEIAQGLVLHYKLDEYCINSILPKGVELYDYIESTGTQWIDTGIYGYMNHKYELDYQQTTAGTFRMWGVFGQQSYAGYNMSITWSSGRQVRWESTSSNTRNIDNIDSYNNTNRHIFIINNGQVYYDGVDKGKSSGHSDSCIINYHIYLFTANPANNTPSYNTPAKVYSYKDYDSSGNLVRNMLPCTYFGEPGMWDTVENKFYRNQGTGTFILGTKIILKEYDYLQSSGTQWINTEQLGNNTTDIELKYSYDALATSIGMLGYGQGSTTEPMNGFRLYCAGSNKFYISCYSRLNASTLPSNITFSTQTIYTTFFKGSTGTVTTNNISNNVGNYGTGTDNTYPLVLFKPYSTCTKGKLYHCKIYNNNILIKNFIPISYNGTSGLWDKVEWKYYANAGTGTFTLGPEKTNNKIYDCSGYGNNGTITGTLSLNNDTPRYNYSISMNNTGTSNHIETEPIGISDNIFTISFWVKSAKSTNQVFVADPKIVIGTLGSLLYVVPTSSKPFTTTNFINNEWNHIVVIRNGNTYSVYINGIAEIQSGSNNYYAHSESRLWLLNRSNNSSYAANTTISDVRIYATPLSNEAILKLYNNPAHIDNKNNLYGFEFDEVDITNPKILKKGIVEIDQFSEVNDHIKVLDDNSVFIQLLHHNNPATNRFTSSNCWLNNTEHLFSQLDLLRNCSWLNSLSEYEFLVYEKLESSSTESIIRWKQTNNPATASTASGYTLISGSPIHLSPGLAKSGTSHGCIDISGTDWWCCCGCYEAYQGGIPGFMGVIKTGYVDLYLRIPELVLRTNLEGIIKFYKKSIISNRLIEK